MPVNPAGAGLRTVESVGLLLGALLIGLLGALATRRYLRHVGRRWSRRAIRRHRARIDRYKLTRKAYVIDQLLGDPAIAAAVERHQRETGSTDAATWELVRGYLHEIVPFFNIVAYYRLGYTVSRLTLGLFYKVRVAYERPDPFRGLPRDAVVIYLMNHRSNADYVLVTYVLMGAVSISYAVGEWARAFPLEVLFKSFGSYFIRRRHREPLYHAVLQAYVQLITRNHVTQGIFPEGGLTRDGALRPAKIGLLGYVLGVATDPAVRPRMYVVPVGINYDRVLEDRTLLRELALQAQRPVTSRWTQLREVAGFLVTNAGRMLTGRWRRYGQAAVTIGAPVSVDAWLRELESAGTDLFALPRAERLGRIQQFGDAMLARIGAIIPVTPVPLACAALQSLEGDFVTSAQLLARMQAMRDVLQELNARELRADRDIRETFDRAYRMLRLRQVLSRVGDGYLVLPRGRPLITYYANSIAHLLGPYAQGVQARDRLPVDHVLD